MPDILLFDWRLDKAIEYESPIKFHPRYISAPSLPLKVMLDAPPPTFQMLQKDPLLHQILVEECKAAFKASLSKIVPRLQALDAECGATNDFYKYAEARKRTLQQIDTDIEQAKHNAMAAIDKRWMTLQTQKREYKSYRLGVGVKIAKGAVGVVGAGVSLGGAVATGGVTLAISIIGTWRAVMDGGKTLWECWLDADKMQKRVQSGLKSLRETYAKGMKQGVSREVAASAVNALLKLPVTLTNIKTLEDDNKLWRGKLTHLRYLAHELSEDLNKLLENCDKLQTQLAADPAAAKKQASLKRFESEINKLLTDGFFIASMGRRVQIQKAHMDAEKGLKVQEEITIGIEDLKKGRSHGVDWFDRVISIGTDLALSVASNVASPPKGVIDGIGIGADALSVLSEIHDIAADEIPKVKEVEDNLKKKFRETVLRDKDIAPPKLVQKPVLGAHRRVLQHQ